MVAAVCVVAESSVGVVTAGVAAAVAEVSPVVAGGVADVVDVV
ncbi:hypothetical protein LLT7_01345 [Lactococcus cremoris subsp. cremoris TIFN7]|nr:hypothetical protein LLT7_01345 [Lactococcus cremoris subsp. cremoris TIFN7]